MRRVPDTSGDDTDRAYEPLPVPYDDRRPRRRWRCRLGFHAFADQRHHIGPCTRLGCTKFVQGRQLGSGWIRYVEPPSPGATPPGPPPKPWPTTERPLAPSLTPTERVGVDLAEKLDTEGLGVALDQLCRDWLAPGEVPAALAVAQLQCLAVHALVLSRRMDSL